jgi:hypothetical protein
VRIESTACTISSTVFAANNNSATLAGAFVVVVTKGASVVFGTSDVDVVDSGIAIVVLGNRVVDVEVVVSGGKVV